jgi:hypothetical protein
MNNTISNEKEELDISWMNDMVCNNDIDVKLDPPSKVEINYIYINSSNEIEGFFKEIHDLTREIFVFEIQSVIKQHQLLKIIQSNKIQNNKRFRLNEILKYEVNLKEEEFTQFIESKISKDINTNSIIDNPSFLKKINYIDDIIFKPSISIFHNVNSLVLIYIENDSIQPPPKPIIKINILNKPCISKKTKKVNFNHHEEKGLNHTKKQMNI